MAEIPFWNINVIICTQQWIHTTPVSPDGSPCRGQLKPKSGRVCPGLGSSSLRIWEVSDEDSTLLACGWRLTFILKFCFHPDSKGGQLMSVEDFIYLLRVWLPNCLTNGEGWAVPPVFLQPQSPGDLSSQRR